MVTRESDARIPIEEERATSGPIIGYRSRTTGREIMLGDPSFNEIQQREAQKAAPRLTPLEQTNQAAELQKMLDSGDLNYPNLARTMLARPDTLFLLPEIGWSYGIPGMPTQAEAVHDLAAETISSILNSAHQPALVAEYQRESKHDSLQQMFWADIGDAYSEEERSAFLILFAQLEEKGAGRIASRALTWAEGKNLRDSAVRDTLLVFIHQEAYKQDQHELMDTGIAGVADFFENQKDNLFEFGAELVTAALGKPEDHIRRSGLTWGEQLAYQAGLRPSDAIAHDIPILGQMSSWDLYSGLADGWSEVVHDPLNLIASMGLAVKAVRTVPMGARAIQAVKHGRVIAAAKAWAAPTKRFSAGARDITGGRVTRSFYMLRGKHLDDFVDSKQSMTVIKDFQRLVKAGDRAELLTRYPKLAEMPEEALDIIKNIDTTADEAAETIKSVMRNDLDLSGEELDMLQRAKIELWEKVARNTDQPTAVLPVTGRIVDSPVHRIKGIASRDIARNIDEGVDPALLKKALIAEAQYQQEVGKVRKFYLIGDSLQAPRKVFSREKFINLAASMPVVGGRKLASGAARITPGTPRGQIALFNTGEGVKDIKEIMVHYGINPEKYRPLLNEFVITELGARQDFIFEKVLPLIGEEANVGVLKHNILQLYRSGKLRQFSNSKDELDIWMDAVGKSHRGPLFGYQFTDQVPVPIQAMDGILRRSNTAGRKGIRLTTIAFPGTKSKRGRIAARYRTHLAKSGVKVSAEEAWQMAYSILAKHGDDGRGWMASKLLPKVGSVWDKQHQFFKINMLLMRAGPWSARVLMEETLRGFVNNLSSLGRNPYAHVLAMRQGGILRKAFKSRQALVDNAMTYSKTIIDDAADSSVIATRLGDMAATVFPEGTPATLTEARKLVRVFMDDAVQTTDINKLGPIVNVRRAARTAARRRQKADELLKSMGIEEDEVAKAFDLIQQQQVSRTFITDAADTFSPAPSIWRKGMGVDESISHGQRYAFHILKQSEDQMGRLAFLRLADKLEGATIGADRTVEAVTRKSSWRLLGPEMQRRFGGTDLENAAQYMETLLEKEVAQLMEPFLTGKPPKVQAELLRRLVRGKVLDTTIDGKSYSINFAHAKQAANQIGEMLVDASDSVRFPNLGAVPVDPRFTSMDPGITRKALAFFGDELSQRLNRRPAWITQFKRYKKHYLDLGLDDYNANKLATTKAANEVNSVFFDSEMAPHLVKKMERFIPFFKATYEVASQWTYKMPVAAGGYWPTGVGEFVRKLDRLMQAMVETGMATVEEDKDGNRAGFTFHAFDHDISLGDPLNPTQFGLLSFFQFAVGASPPGTLLMSSVKGLIPAASNERVEESADETWAELADRLGVDAKELAQLNRALFFDGDAKLGKATYLSIVGEVADLDSVSIPKGLAIRIPGSGMINALEELLLPMGEISIADMPMSYLPATIRNFMAGLSLTFSSKEEFWEEGGLGMIDGFVPKQFEASIMSQGAEQVMWLEASDNVDGKGPLARIMEKEQKLQKLTGTAANDLQEEIEADTEAYIKRIKEGVAGGLILKGFKGQFIPTTPRKARENNLEINSYWASREFADSMQSGKGEYKIQPFKNKEQIDAFLELTGQWLKDDTGEGAKATFARQNPTLLAYLTPKTFFGEAGMPAEINAYEDYVDQIKSGARVSPPPFITAMRYYQASIAVDHHNEWTARYGNDPTQAAANAINDRMGYRQMQEKRSDAYMAIDMFDDMNGLRYQAYRNETQRSDDWFVDDLIERRRDLSTALGTLLDLAEDDGDGTIDAGELLEDAGVFKKALALVSASIRELQDSDRLAEFRNPFEEAYNKYFTDYYVPYNEGLSELYDKITVESDSEKAKLVYEEIRDYRNSKLDEEVVIDGVNFTNAQDYQWSGKTPEEQDEKRRLWLSRPLEWMDASQVRAVLETMPEMAEFLPTNPSDFLLYHQATVAKIYAEEQFEANEITSGDLNKIRKAVDEELRLQLILTGRSGEAEFLDLTPYEKLRFGGVLPTLLDNLEYREAQSYYIEVLAVKDKSADTGWGRITIDPFMKMLIHRTEIDPAFKKEVIDLGESLFEMSFVDHIFPKLFFDAKER